MKQKSSTVYNQMFSVVKDIFTEIPDFTPRDEWYLFEELLQKPEFISFTKNVNGFYDIFNFRSNRYEFMSEGIREHLGYDPSEFVGERGVEKMYAVILPEHASVMVDPISKNILSYISANTTPETLKDYRYSCCVKAANTQGVYKWFILDSVIIQTDENGFPLRSLTTCTNIDPFKKDEVIHYHVSKKDRDGIYQVVYEGSINTVLNQEVLTLRESEILSFIAQGLTNSQIADKLYISIDTVKAHRRNILKKTNCKGPIELANFAFSRGLV